MSAISNLTMCLHHAIITEVRPDSSGKRHYRAILPSKSSYIILDCSYDAEVAQSLVKANRLMHSNGFSAPQIYEYNEAESVILMEDLGSMSYRAALESAAHSEIELYIHAVKALVAITRLDHTAVALPKYQAQELELALDQTFLQHYASTFIAQEQLQEAIESFRAIFKTLYKPMLSLQKTIALRDYHIDNMMWLADREDYKKVGLLDIQDASLSFIGYDLISLIEDARRDVSADVAEACMKYFCSSIPELGQDTLDYTCQVLGMQRSLRILGVFYHMAQFPGKRKYAQCLPRVSRYIKSHLKNIIFQDLMGWLDQYQVSLLYSEDSIQR